MFFFFQAEDGIRDLVRSRGLGDVYKRQDQETFIWADGMEDWKRPWEIPMIAAELSARGLAPVSYTHLTLPTSDLV